MQKALCRYCNSYRPYTHIYCYICGKELILPTTKFSKEVKPSNKKKYIKECKFCRTLFNTTSTKRSSCYKDECEKLRTRFNWNNWYRRKVGLPKLVIFNPKNCDICQNPIPNDLISNSNTKFCSEECRRVGARFRYEKYLSKALHNGKEYLPSM